MKNQFSTERITKCCWINIHFNKCSLMKWINSTANLFYPSAMRMNEKYNSYNCNGYLSAHAVSYLNTMLPCIHSNRMSGSILLQLHNFFLNKKNKNAFIILSQRHKFNFFLCTPHSLALHCTLFFYKVKKKQFFSVNTITVRDFQKWPFWRITQKKRMP